MSTPASAGPLLAGRYRLVERRGQGSTGVLYRSFDVELEEWVAVKLLRPELTDRPHAHAGLRRAVRLARRVAHRNVARCFEFCQTAGRHFLIFEYIAAESLHERLGRAGRLAPEELPGLALDLCKGLAAAHAAGVIHGDLKPGNVLLAPDRGAVITDGGIAHSLFAPAFDDGLVTGSHHAAPELLRGAAPTPAADLYALASMLFEARTGLHIWAGLDAQAVAARRLDGPGPDLRALAPDLAGGWLGLLSDCLRHRPEDRPVDAQVVVARLIELYRGTGHVPMSHTREGEQSLTPLGSLPGARWLAVHPFTAAEPDLQASSAWIAGDLVQALRHVRSLRVVRDGPGPRHGPVAQIHGELRRLGDGLRVTLRVAAAADAEPLELVVDHPRGLLPVAGVELAAQVLATLGVQDRSPAATRPITLHSDAVDHYLAARTAMTAMRTADAIAHFEAALALAPRHRALRLAYVTARVLHGLTYKRLTADELADLRALVEATLAELGPTSETCTAMAGLLVAIDEPLEATRWTCTSLAHAPSGPALVILARLLLKIGRVQDVARRLEIAATLEPGSAYGWLAHAELLVWQDRWDEFFAVFDGPLTRLRVRGIYISHYLLRRPEPAVLARLAVAVDENHDRLHPDALADLRALVDFLLSRRDRRQILDELAASPGHGTRSRRLQMQCEMACIIGDLTRAHHLLALADQDQLIDWLWLTQSPTLAPLRADPAYLTVRDRVRERADAVAEIIWGSGSLPPDP